MFAIHCDNNQFVIIALADDTVLTVPVSTEAFHISDEGFAMLVWIVRMFNIFLQLNQDRGGVFVK